jgi:hypothetical protein
MTDDEFITQIMRALCMIIAAINKRYGRAYKLEK